ncbi:MAG: PQQ-dependent sugar dehydrogenase [Opitutales bacterium]|nr:PQQ-dependent sugar dehydrogenase [Opitutales bacterium]
MVYCRRFIQWLLLIPLPFVPAQAETFETERRDIRVVEVTGGLQNPWGFAFLPEGGVLITERSGRLRLWDGDALHTVDGVPTVVASGQGGMLDVVLHPDFGENRLVYLTHSAAYEGGVGTTVTRGRLDADVPSLEDVETIYRMPAPGGGGQHFGSRMAFDAEGYLFVSVGDRGQQNRAQDLQRAEGSLLRLYDDGSIPSDNPFTDDPEALDEIWSYGHRNAQGLFYDAETGILWQHEHGPRGGDTLNAITRGANYGWPVATYGEEYSDASPIGDLPHERDDIENPFAYWTPTSIAPSGLTRYHGHAVPHWRGDLFLGALVQRHIRRLVVDDEGVVHEEEILRNDFGRIRDIRTGPDDLLYFVTDENPGGLYRIEPAEVSWWFGLPSNEGWRATAGSTEGGDIGPVYDGYWPWIAVARLGDGAWLWVAEAKSNPEAVTAYRAAETDDGTWIHLLTETGWYYDYDEETWHPLE